MVRKRLWMPVIDRGRVLSSLGYDVLPAHGLGPYPNFPWYDSNGDLLFRSSILVKPPGSRIYAECPICMDFIRFDRLRHHINTATCDSAALRNVYTKLDIFTQMRANMLMNAF